MCYTFLLLKCASIAVLCILTVNLFAQPNKSTPKNQQNAADNTPHTVTFINNQESPTDAHKAQPHAPTWYASSEWWLVVIAALTGGFIASQASEMRRATEVMQDQLRHMRESSERQLRAYVVSEMGSICNIAPPVRTSGPTPQTDARITHPDWGPVATMRIKNAGQTPAFRVQHWGNMCFGEYPLTSILPPKDASVKPIHSMLGPGIISTKLFRFGPPLTPEQISALRAGTGAIYVYGEILYEDAFGTPRYTRYRLMHHLMGGAIGVSTDLGFAEDGNDAN